FDPAANSLTHLEERWDAGSNGQDITVSPDGNHIAFPCGGGNGAGYTIIDFSSDNLNVTFGAWNTNAYPRAAAFTADGTRLVGRKGDDVMVFDSSTHALVESHSISFAACSYGMISRVAVSPAGGIVYAISKCGFNDDSGRLYWFAQ